MNLGLAFRAFFAALFNSERAARLKLALQDSPTTVAPATVAPAAEPAKQTTQAPKTVKPAVPVRSEALTLLSTLQREARLLDLVHESLDDFKDEQIGAAAREVLRDCRQSLNRMFAIEPLSQQQEGESCAVDSASSPVRLRVVGSSQGASGTIAHRGWQAQRCELPVWNGQAVDALVLAPVEVDVR